MKVISGIAQRVRSDSCATASSLEKAATQHHFPSAVVVYSDGCLSEA